MNHNCAHCLDFEESCPRNCLRAELVRDLETNPIYWKYTSWRHFADTEECPLRQEDEE